jgi:hypothetical protein
VSVFRRHVALPADHGSWAFFLKPLLIGLFAGGHWHTTAIYLTIAALCAFLVRQPIALVVKAHAGRRPRDVLPAAWFWIAIYAGIGTLHVVGLVLRGFGYLLYLAIPGMLVFGWYLLLLSRREERRAWGMEILATGAMALAAPAGLWAGAGTPDPIGWLLWLLVWAQSATAIVFVYLRLEQRRMSSVPEAAARLRMGAASLLAASLGLALALALGRAGLISPWLFVPYAVQWVEVVWGTWRPAVGLRPTAIGFRQLAVSALFTVLFVIFWGAAASH